MKGSKHPLKTEHKSALRIPLAAASLMVAVTCIGWGFYRPAMAMTSPSCPVPATISPLSTTTTGSFKDGQSAGIYTLVETDYGYGNNSRNEWDYKTGPQAGQINVWDGFTFINDPNPTVPACANTSYINESVGSTTVTPTQIHSLVMINPQGTTAPAYGWYFRPGGDVATVQKARTSNADNTAGWTTTVTMQDTAKGSAGKCYMKVLEHQTDTCTNISTQYNWYVCGTVNPLGSTTTTQVPGKKGSCQFPPDDEQY